MADMPSTIIKASKLKTEFLIRPTISFIKKILSYIERYSVLAIVQSALRVPLADLFIAMPT